MANTTLTPPLPSTSSTTQPAENGRKGYQAPDWIHAGIKPRTLSPAAQAFIKSQSMGYFDDETKAEKPSTLSSEGNTVFETTSAIASVAWENGTSFTMDVLKKGFTTIWSAASSEITTQARYMTAQARGEDPTQVKSASDYLYGDFSITSMTDAKNFVLGGIKETTHEATKQILPAGGSENKSVAANSESKPAPGNPEQSDEQKAIAEVQRILAEAFQKGQQREQDYVMEILASVDGTIADIQADRAASGMNTSFEGKVTVHEAYATYLRMAEKKSKRQAEGQPEGKGKAGINWTQNTVDQVNMEGSRDKRGGDLNG